MLGRNHALYGAAGWMASWPILNSTGLVDISVASGVEALGMTTVIAAGASVIPDLDHPDARPAKQFGILSKMIAKSTNKLAGGHRMITHTIAFGLMLGAAMWSLGYLPTDISIWPAMIISGMCCSLGIALVGPSLGFYIPQWVDWASAVGAALWVYARYEQLALYNILPLIVVYGVIIHILCDGVTKGGVPLLWPITKKRFALGLFRVAGPGETVATVIGVIGFFGALWYAVNGVAS